MDNNTLTMPSDTSSIRSPTDSLPPYSSSLQLAVLCRRKKEPRGHLQKSRHRSWETVWMVLDGTALNVFRPTPEERRDLERTWKEKTRPIKPEKPERTWLPWKKSNSPVTVVTPIVKQQQQQQHTTPRRRTSSIAT